MSFVVTWLLLAGFWIGLSGYYDAIHLTFGAVSVTLVTLLSHKHLTGGSGIGRGLLMGVRTILYLPWLFWQIFIANFDVMLRIAGIRPIEPRVFRFKADLSTEYGRVLLANSITLTPGTVTVAAEEDNEFVVHALTKEAAEAVLQSVMERKVRAVEGDG